MKMDDQFIYFIFHTLKKIFAQNIFVTHFSFFPVQPPRQAARPTLEGLGFPRFDDHDF